MAVATVHKTRARQSRRSVPKPESVGYQTLLLETGDRLTREEFERRYAAMPQVKKAELIEGVVYMASPVRIDHGYAHGQIIAWLGVYCAGTPGVTFADNATVRLDSDNEVQPDALLRIESAGQSRISPDRYIENAPELIVEVACSSVSYDLYDKFKVYRRNKVQEYVIWQVYENTLTWFQLQKGQYVPVPPDADGVIHGTIFPGLSLKVDALLAGDLADVLDVQQHGLRTEKHAAFIEWLRNT